MSPVSESSRARCCASLYTPAGTPVAATPPRSPGAACHPAPYDGLADTCKQGLGLDQDVQELGGQGVDRASGRRHSSSEVRQAMKRVSEILLAISSRCHEFGSIRVRRWLVFYQWRPRRQHRGRSSTKFTGKLARRTPSPHIDQHVEIWGIKHILHPYRPSSSPATIPDAAYDTATCTDVSLEDEVLTFQRSFRACQTLQHVSVQLKGVFEAAGHNVLEHDSSAQGRPALRLRFSHNIPYLCGHQGPGAWPA